MESIYRQLQEKPFSILVLLGTTASGKTELALKLAKKIGAEIISSDSVQVYKQLDIGSAKPKSEQLKSVPHHLISVLEPQEFYSAGKFVEFAEQALEQIYQRKKIPILLGGNMLYVNCLLKGMASIPTVSEKSKLKVAELYKKGLSFCYNELIKRDKLAKGNILLQDTQRILRALEVVLSHKKSIYQFHQEHKKEQKKYQPIYLGIESSREQIQQNISYRLKKMLEEGFLLEVEKLLEKYAIKTPALQSIGYKQVILFLQKKITKEAMIEQIQYKTRQYAKRQMTWYKKISNAVWLKKENIF